MVGMTGDPRPWRQVRLGDLTPVVDERPDGSVVLRARQPLGPYPRVLTERLEQWARAVPGRTLLSWREAGGRATLTYGEAWPLGTRRRSGAHRPRAVSRAAARDSVRQRRRSICCWRSPRSTSAFPSRRCRPRTRSSRPISRRSSRSCRCSRQGWCTCPIARSLRPPSRRRYRQAAEVIDRSTFGTLDVGDERAGGRPSPSGNPTRPHRQDPLHVGIDGHAEGRDQHAPHALQQPADDPADAALSRRRAAGPRRLAAVAPHLRRQPQPRHRRLQRRVAATSTTGGPCPAPLPRASAACARSCRRCT